MWYIPIRQRRTNHWWYLWPHTDVVFPDTTPLPLKEEDGKICCPGVGDDTANLVALLLTARYVTQKHLSVKDCGILFVCNSCEEGMGNLKGSRKICETYGSRIREFYSFDGTMGLAGKPGGWLGQIPCDRKDQRRTFLWLLWTGKCHWRAGIHH